MRTASKFNRLRLLQLAFLAGVLLLTLGATDNTRFDKLGHKLMCQCGCGQVLLECNHVGCTTSEKMRAELTAMMNNGDDDRTILQRFVEKYGPVVLAAPTQSGFNRVAWIMPYLALVLAIGGCAFVVHKWNKRRAPVPVNGPGNIDSSSLSEYRKRVNQETEF